MCLAAHNLVSGRNTIKFFKSEPRPRQQSCVRSLTNYFGLTSEVCCVEIWAESHTETNKILDNRSGCHHQQRKINSACMEKLSQVVIWEYFDLGYECWKVQWCKPIILWVKNIFKKNHRNHNVMLLSYFRNYLICVSVQPLIFRHSNSFIWQTENGSPNSVLGRMRSRWCPEEDT